MILSLSFSLLLLLCANSVHLVDGDSSSSVTLKGQVQLPPNPVALSSSEVSSLLGGLQVTLNGGQSVTTTLRDGSFSFHNVSTGFVYIVEFEQRTLLFSTYKVQVAEDDIAVLEYRYPGAPKLPSVHPIVALPIARTHFFEQRAKMGILSFLMNPQMLMVLVVGGLSLCLPTIMKYAKQAESGGEGDAASVTDAEGGGGDLPWQMAAPPLRHGDNPRNPRKT